MAALCFGSIPDLPESAITRRHRHSGAELLRPDVAERALTEAVPL
jgi:hypothetical protein